MDRAPVTSKGADRLKDELNELKTVRRFRHRRNSHLSNCGRY